MTDASHVNSGWRKHAFSKPSAGRWRAGGQEERPNAPQPTTVDAPPGPPSPPRSLETENKRLREALEEIVLLDPELACAWGIDVAHKALHPETQP
jgi:hypothetical protein